MKTSIEYLEQFCEEISPLEFYRLIFPEGSLDDKDKFTPKKYCGVAVSVNKAKKVKRFTITDDLETIGELTETKDFCLTSPISYAGKSRSSNNARFLHAIAIDLDGLTLPTAKAGGVSSLVVSPRRILRVFIAPNVIGRVKGNRQEQPPRENVKCLSFPKLCN